MQHIEIHDPAHCTIVNMDGGDARPAAPPQQAARICRQCTQPTWRLTPVCMHCGYHRWTRMRLVAGTTAGAAALLLVLFHRIP